MAGQLFRQRAGQAKRAAGRTRQLADFLAPVCRSALEPIASGSAECGSGVGQCIDLARPKTGAPAAQGRRHAAFRATYAKGARRSLPRGWAILARSLRRYVCWFCGWKSSLRLAVGKNRPDPADPGTRPWGFRSTNLFAGRTGTGTQFDTAAISPSRK